MTDYTKSYWMDVEPLEGDLSSPPESGEIIIIGSGLAGVSTAYWLLESGLDNIVIVDYNLPHSATFRNCGHILYGTVESIKALVSLHGLEKAKEVWQYSIDICNQVKDTIDKLNIECEYEKSGYYVIAIDETEDKEVKESVDLLNQLQFSDSPNNYYLSKEEVEKLGFKNTFGARFEGGSAKAHPVKFRNALLRNVISRGVKYYSNVQVKSIEEVSGKVVLETNKGKLVYDAGIIAANAYSPLLSKYFEVKRLVEPFKGQIITSKPLKHQFKVKGAHSFDHGYEYSLITEDNRLMIGGWRNNVSGKEIGTYGIIPNEQVSQGLKDFVSNHYNIEENIEWEYSWAGIMAASKTGFPFIGPLDNGSPIYTCTGWTGHGFSWAHGSAKLLTDIIMGNSLPKGYRYYNPKGD